VFKVTATDALTVTLQYESGPLPPLYFDFAARHLTDTAIAEINRLARGYFFRDATWTATTRAVGYFPDVVARLYSATAGTLTGEFTPIAAPPINVLGLMPVLEDRLLDSDGKLLLDWPSSGSPAQPSTGTRFNLYAFPTPISADNPLHLSGHPIDLDTAVYDVRGVAYDAASAASVKAALGPISALYRLTGGDTTGAWLVKNLRGPCGYTARQNDAGEREYILVRPHPTATPTATITLDALRGGDDGPEGVVFDLDSASKRNVVTLNVQTFRRWLDADKDAGVSRPPDFILTTPASVTEELDSDADGTPDWETQGRKEITYDLPGRLQIGDPTSKSLFGGATDLITSIAHEVFAIRGRGAPVGDAMVLRGTDADAARVGDFVLVNCDHIPSTDTTQSPTGVRGGTVVAQVLRRTRVAGGADLHLEYRGTATQTALVPTFTVTKNADDPRHTATFTLTNGPALAAAGAKVRVQMATGTSTPTAGAPLRVIDPSVTTAFDLPGQDAGTKVWASARAEVGVEAPGAYTAFAGVQLDSLTAPSSLSASASSNVVTMSWTVGDADVPEEIIFKLSGEADYRAPIPVAAGTDHYTLILPTAGTWTVGVREHESPPYSGVSAAATASVTTSTASALTAPVNPAVFSDGAGGYGGEVTGTVYPSNTDMWVAPETSIGSGTAGTYVLAGSVTTVQNGRTRLTTTAPNDGLLRFVKFKHTQSGATDSAFTTALSVSPWTQTSLPPQTLDLQLGFDGSGHLTVRWTGDAATQSIKIAASTSATPSDATVRAATALDGRTGTTGTLVTATAGQTVYVSARSYTGLAGAGTESAVAFTAQILYSVSPVTSVFSRTGAVVAVSGDYTVSQVTGAAPLASPTFTGTPAAPTASAGTNTTQLATTAFVTAAVAAGGGGGGSANHAYYTYKAAALEPLAIEALNYGAFSYAINSSTTKLLLGSWSTRLGSSGRLEHRDPSRFLPLRNVTMTGLSSTSLGAFINPTLATYADARTTYYDRLNTIATTATKYLAVTAPNTKYPFLPGPYGTIITQVTNFDLTWLVLSYDGGASGLNIANEVGDTGSTDYQRNTNVLMMPVSKNIAGCVLTGAERTAGAGAGGVAYILCPSTWGLVTDPTSYTFRDDFTGASLDTATTWTRNQSTVGNVEIDTNFAWCKCVGSGTWGQNGARRQTGIARATGKVFLCDIYTGATGTNSPLIVGWNAGTGNAQADFAHGVNLTFSGSSVVSIYEGNTNRGTVGSGWSANTIYRIRITLGASNNATYEIQGGTQYQKIGSASWSNITPGTSSNATGTLYPGFASFNGDSSTYVGDVRVY
jgi:hypothetical protein